MRFDPVMVNFPFGEHERDDPTEVPLSIAGKAERVRGDHATGLKRLVQSAFF
jgi:hypothetical protein